jgi:hypothetical protein
MAAEPGAPHPSRLALAAAGAAALLAAECAALFAGAGRAPDAFALMCAGLFSLGALRLFGEIPRRWRKAGLWAGAVSVRAAALAPEFSREGMLAAAADLAVVFLLLRMLTGPGRYRVAAWYAWNPLAAWAFAGSGAVSAALANLACTAAAWALHRANPLGRSAPARLWCAAGALSLGAGAALGGLPLAILPAFAIGLGRRIVLLLIALAVPAAWGLAESGNPLVAWDRLRAFLEPATSGGGFLWGPLEPLLHHSGAGESSGLWASVGASLAAVFWFRARWRMAALAGLGALLLVGPGFHPADLAWVLPLACWMGRREWFLLSASCPALLLLGHPGFPPALLWCAAFAPPVAALFARRMAFRTFVD